MMRFANCHFDFSTFSTTGSAGVTAKDCLTDGAMISFVPTCFATRNEDEERQPTVDTDDDASPHSDAGIQVISAAFDFCSVCELLVRSICAARDFGSICESFP
jgi:hypothetical protein